MVPCDVTRWIKAVDIERSVLLEEVLGDIDQPVGSHATVATHTLLKHILLVDCRHPDIIELAPDALVVVADKCKVVSALGAAIVDADRMQMVGHILQSLVSVRDLAADFCDLAFQTLDLRLRCLQIVLKCVDQDLLCACVWLLRLVQRKMGLRCCKNLEVIRHCRHRIGPLPLKERHRCANCLCDVDIGVSEPLVLCKTTLQKSDVGTQLLHLVPLGLDFLLVCNHEAVRIDDFVNLDFVQHFLRPTLLELEPVHLECKYTWQLFDPVDLLGPNMSAIFACVVLDGRSVLAVPDCIEILARGDVKKYVGKSVRYLLLLRLIVLVFKVENSFQLALEASQQLVLGCCLLGTFVLHLFFQQLRMGCLDTEAAFASQSNRHCVVLDRFSVEHHRIGPVFALVLRHLLNAASGFERI